MSAPLALRATAAAVGYEGRAVVEGIDVAIARGEALALVGTNGSGKSTFLKTVVGLLEPLAGTIEVLGSAPGRRPRQIAYLGQFHQSALVLPLRAADVVRMGRFSRHGLLGRIGRADEEAVVRAMARTDVTHLADAPLRSLSGGQQQRVYLAQVLAKEADVLVLDEPTAGLDAGSREHYLSIIDAERARGAAVVTATHDIGEAMRCEKTVLLAQRVVAAGRPADVLTPDHLLEAFGVALQAVQHLGHTDVLTAEAAHAHHPHGLPGHQHDHAGH